jgi:uncharacterized protein YcgL (UPF0745 family)
MKRNWTNLIKPSEAYTSDKDRMSSHFYEFNKEHYNACEIVTNKFGEPVAAIYFSLKGKTDADLKAIMRAIRDRTCVGE